MRRRALELVVGAAVVAGLWWLADAYCPTLLYGSAVEGGRPIERAFWHVIVLIGSAILKGLQIAGQITLKILAWSVSQLWVFAKNVFNAAREIGRAFIVGIRESWQFLRTVYDDVLKPAWQTFWRWFDRFRGWLESIFRPVFDFLNTLRQWVLDIYTKYVRPIVDAIDIARRVLRVLSSLGLDWARALDARLAQLQDHIQAPFRIALAKINEIVNLLNTVVTFNGLIQRVALLRSIERDIRYVQRAFANWREFPLTPDDFDELRRRANPKTDAAQRERFRANVTPDLARNDPVIVEMAAIWRIEMRGGQE
jgi:hypothetical protein